MFLSQYSIRDNKLSTFKPPFCADSDVSAKRFIIISLKTNPELQQFAGDFDLYRVGIFDDATGQSSSSVPEMVDSVENLKKVLEVKKNEI
jgi:hypothetical protein